METYSKKKIMINQKTSILKVKIAYVLLLVFTLLYAFFLDGGKEGFTEGLNSVNTRNQINKVSGVIIKENAIQTNISFYDSLKVAKSYKEVILYGKEKPGGANWLAVIKFVSIMSFTFIAISVFVKLYAFINAITKNKVFEITNIKRLSDMGWGCIALGPISFLAHYVSDKKDQLLIRPLSFDVKFSFDFEFWPIVMGVTLLTIAFAFKRGLEIKQENDLTV